MNKRIDLTGQRFSRLMVIKFSHVKQGNSHWLCKCDCGNETVVQNSNLVSGHTKSCGCYSKETTHNVRFINLTDRKFNRLKVISFAYIKNATYYWLCRCDCGRNKIINRNHLISGNTQSCGCLRDEKIRNNSLGSKNPNWRDGSSKEPYPKIWTGELKELIRNRDYRKCQFQDCEYDDTKEKRKLDVHHIDGNRNNCEPTNLISLCHKHHMLVESNSELWIDYFYQITGDYRDSTTELLTVYANYDILPNEVEDNSLAKNLLDKI